MMLLPHVREAFVYAIENPRMDTSFRVHCMWHGEHAPECDETYELKVTYGEASAYLLDLELIQNALPTWSPDERELCMSGISGPCFAQLSDDFDEDKA